MVTDGKWKRLGTWAPQELNPGGGSCVKGHPLQQWVCLEKAPPQKPRGPWVAPGSTELTTSGVSLLSQNEGQEPGLKRRTS